MRPLPVADPGTPDLRSPTRYLLWVARMDARTLTGGMALGVGWMVCHALVPAAIGNVIDGIAVRDRGALLTWTGVVCALGVLQAVFGIMRHRFAVFNWLSAAYRTVQLTTRQAGRLGATLPKRLATGEVVSIGTSDISHIGGAMDIMARGTGAVLAIAVVVAILLRASAPLGLVVVLGVPVLMGIVALLIRPLHHRQQAYRDRTGTLTTRAGDIVAGLRVLRGIGGEAMFADRYRSESGELREAGVRVARVDSLLQAAQVLLPGVFIALVTWLGARFAVRGDITPGELVAFYGYAVFLVFPLRTLTEVLERLIRGHVAARRVVRVLALEPEIADPVAAARVVSTVEASLVDPESGLVVKPRRLTAIAAAAPEDAAAIVDRLGRYVDSEAALDGVPLRKLERAAVRDLILVADNDARLFTGPLSVELDLRGGTEKPTASLAPSALDRSDAVDARLADALRAASAEDIVAALPDGLATRVAERGREFSGGQQQRLRLVRALLADPPVLVLVEPTSAVDAHTEAQIADRLGEARVGRTTVVCTTSPLVLDRADHVVYVEDGKVIAEGTHSELLESEPRYAAVVTRGEDE